MRARCQRLPVARVQCAAMMADVPWIVRRGPRSRRLLLLLHGNAEDERSFAAYGALLDPRRDFALVVPRGPLVAKEGFGWYRVGASGPEPDTFFPALAYVDALLERACQEQQLPREEALIAGFCQGGALGLALALRESARCVPPGILFMSGYWAEPPGMSYRLVDPERTAVLAISGTHDSVIPPARQEDAARALEARGLRVERRSFAMGHQVTLESLAGARDWLDRFRAA
jgi:predicted esterase